MFKKKFGTRRHVGHIKDAKIQSYVHDQPRMWEASWKIAQIFHNVVAKLLYLCRSKRQDIQTAMAFLCKWVKSPDTDNYKKLGRVIQYMRGTQDLTLTMEQLQKQSYSIFKTLEWQTAWTIQVPSQSTTTTLPTALLWLAKYLGISVLDWLAVSNDI